MALGVTTVLAVMLGGVAEMIEQGATLGEIIAAKPTMEWDEHRGNPNQPFG